MSEKENLDKLYQELEEIVDAECKCLCGDFDKWQKKCSDYIKEHFSKNEHREFVTITIELLSKPLAYNGDTYSITADYFEKVKNLFQKHLDSIGIKEASPKIFIVHGHDENFKLKVARLIERQGLEAIILHEQVNQGKTIMEKVESYGNSVSAAIILFTADDEGKAVSENMLNSRARQNVVFEAGYFIGLLGRDRIIPLVKDGSIELPSDLKGVVYENDNWEIKTLRELKAMGFDIDMNKLQI